MVTSRLDRKIRVALVGAGQISQASILPAFEHAERVELCAVVSGDEARRARLAQRYDVSVTGSPDDLEQVLGDSRADAVYLTSESAARRSQTQRAARAGAHVLCETPMADTALDCQAMIEACEAAHVQLMLAYRLHFDDAYLEAVNIARGGQLGVPRLFTSLLSQPAGGRPTRARQERRGTALHELAPYPIHAARHLFGAEPIGVLATSAASGQRPTLLDATACAHLIFEDERLAQIGVSLVGSPVSSYRLIGDKGDLLAEPGYGLDQPSKQVLTLGANSVERRFLHRRHQVSAALDAFARAVLEGGEHGTSGREGLADVRVLEALLESLRSGRRVSLPSGGRAGRRAFG